MRFSIIAALSSLLIVTACAFADAATPTAGESFQIESAAHPGQLLRVEDAKSADGTPMVLYPKQAWRCMTWELQADGDGVRLKNHFTKKTLGPTTAPSGSANAPVVQRPLAKSPVRTEAWQFVPIDGKPGLFRIVHTETGLALEADDEGNVVAKKPSDAANQQWRLLPKPQHFTG
jgi:hypothetical protein